jgi:hypothetical protein
MGNLAIKEIIAQITGKFFSRFLIVGLIFAIIYLAIKKQE